MGGLPPVVCATHQGPSRYGNFGLTCLRLGWFLVVCARYEIRSGNLDGSHAWTRIDVEYAVESGKAPEFSDRIVEALTENCYLTEVAAGRLLHGGHLTGGEWRRLLKGNR